MQKNGYTFTIVYSSKCVSVFLHQTLVCSIKLSCAIIKNGILLLKQFCSTVRNNCSSDREFFLKFKAEGREFAKFLRSLEQLYQTVRTIFGNRMLF